MSFKLYNFLVAMILIFMALMASNRIDRTFEVASKKWVLAQFLLVLLFATIDFWIYKVNPRLFFGK